MARRTRKPAPGRSKSSRSRKPSAPKRATTGPNPSWKGMISFGLVNVPVNLYAAVKPEIHEMNYLRKGDFCPIAYKKICRETGEEVPFKDIVRGYEYRKGDFVVLNEEDFHKADAKRTSTIDVEVFVDEREVDPKYIEKPYYLEPQSTAHKAYALFRDAMAESGRVGIGRFVFKDREHLVMLKPEGRAILLVLLRFSGSVRDASELDLPGKPDVPASQMELAQALVKKLEGSFKPEAYRDTYAARLREIIAAKSKGKTVHVREEKAPKETEVEDILSRLKESLAVARH